MERRQVLKHLAVASAVAWLMPSCVSDPKKVTVALNNLNISADEENLIGQLADAIIPGTDTPGARSVEAHLFTLIMVDDCLEKPEQEKYLKGLRSFSTTRITGNEFFDASPEDQAKIITYVELHADKLSEEINFFYAKTKAYVIQGYLNSMHFMTSIKPYKLVPGPKFDGCSPLSTKITL